MMKHLLTMLALCCVSVSALAQVLEYQRGIVVWSPACEDRRMFQYFNGERIVKACIGNTEQVTVDKFMMFATISTCPDQVRVNQGTIVDGVLYATEIEEGRYCSDPGGRHIVN